MNVPQARSRISLAPSMLVEKKGRGKHTMMVEKPMVEGGMALPINISASQKRTLKKGGAITIKPDMIMKEAKEELKLLPASAKKIMNAIVKNKGIRHSLKQGEDLMNRMTGKGLFENFVRAIIPSAKSGLEKVGEPFKAVSGVNPATLGYDLGYKAIGPALVGKGAKKRGGNVFTKLFTKTIPSAIMGKAKEYTQKPQDIVADVLDAESPMKIPVINKNPEALLLRGKGGRLVSSRMGCGSPYVSMPYKQALGRKQGGSFLPAGGAGIYPAGKYGMGMVMAGVDVPIQLGNPYLHSSSPAMNPFMITRGIQSSQSI